MYDCITQKRDFMGIDNVTPNPTYDFESVYRVILCRPKSFLGAKNISYKSEEVLSDQFDHFKYLDFWCGSLSSGSYGKTKNVCRMHGINSHDIPSFLRGPSELKSGCWILN